MLHIDAARFRSHAPRAPLTLPSAPRSARGMQTIGVTGTNGKTTTSSWIASALAAVRATPVLRTSTVGYFLDEEPLGLPPDYEAFVAMMTYAKDRGARDVVLELTSKALLNGYGASFPATVGVFTNLSHDHLDNHTTMEAYLHAKALLFTTMAPNGTAVLNACDLGAGLIAEKLQPNTKLLTFAVGSRGTPWRLPTVRAVASKVTWYGTEARCFALSPDLPRSFVLRTRGVGDAFLENALAALLAATAAGVPFDVALYAIAEAAPPPGRFQVVTRHPCAVVDFAHTPDAIARTIATAKRIAKGKVTIVLGAGGERDRAKRPFMGRAAGRADRVIVTSDNPRTEDPAAIAWDITRGLVMKKDVCIELDRAEAIDLAIREAAPEDVVLICGKGHEKTQLIGRTSVPFDDIAHARTASFERQSQERCA